MSLTTVQTYHQGTKHHFQRYASGPDGLDWKNQPDPFRRFAGCNTTKLPLLTEPTTILYEDLYCKDKHQIHDYSLASIAQLFELSLGLSAWKQAGETRWPLRCNPSSGNLHPTEAYLILDKSILGIEPSNQLNNEHNINNGIKQGIYHYVSCDHLLEQRCNFNYLSPQLPSDSFLIGLSSIHWREAWKYGERAFRYCQHDVGHAIAAIRYAAATLGWQVQILSGISDVDLACLCGIDRNSDFTSAEPEHADVMLLVNTQGRKLANINVPLTKLSTLAQQGQWTGQANKLSSTHGDDWPIISDVASNSKKNETSESIWKEPSYPLPLPHLHSIRIPASQLIKQRRSAQQFDSRGKMMSQSSFYRLLDLTLPRSMTAPLDTIPWQPRIHLLFFIHHVEELEPGLYILLRNDTAKTKTSFQQSLSSDFQWLKPHNCPQHIELFQLVAGDARNAAKTLSCHQEIASDGILSLAMIAEYTANLDSKPWQYRQYFWEAGIIGQTLYLEAESMGLRGTGIGCYFDDAVHELLDINDDTLQSLYHFTIGQALEDERLQTLPPYAHLQRS
ncbi:MAG: SagB/ThcOx family dehydrogenase [Pseudomonadota bacterium]